MENIIDEIKVKEEEMEALLREAKENSRAVREDALRKAKEIRGSMLEAFEAEMRSAASIDEARTDERSREILTEAREDAKLLAAKAASRMESAVQELMRIVMEGASDKRDDEGPDNRAEKPSR